MLTTIPRAGLLQGVVPLRQRQPDAYSAQGVEALEVNEISDDGLEAEYQEAVALTAILKQRRAGKPHSLETTRPSSTSASRNFYVYKVDDWAMGKTVTFAWPK